MSASPSARLFCDVISASNVVGYWLVLVIWQEVLIWLVLVLEAVD